MPDVSSVASIAGIISLVGLIPVLWKCFVKISKFWIAFKNAPAALDDLADMARALQSHIHELKGMIAESKQMRSKVARRLGFDYDVNQCLTCCKAALEVHSKSAQDFHYLHIPERPFISKFARQFRTAFHTGLIARHRREVKSCLESIGDAMKTTPFWKQHFGSMSRQQVGEGNVYRALESSVVHRRTITSDLESLPSGFANSAGDVAGIGYGITLKTIGPGAIEAVAGEDTQAVTNEELGLDRFFQSYAGPGTTTSPREIRDEVSPHQVHTEDIAPAPPIGGTVFTIHDDLYSNAARETSAADRPSSTDGHSVSTRSHAVTSATGSSVNSKKARNRQYNIPQWPSAQPDLGNAASQTGSDEKST